MNIIVVYSNARKKTSKATAMLGNKVMYRSKTRGKNEVILRSFHRRIMVVKA
jgi:hypothetical protein